MTRHQGVIAEHDLSLCEREPIHIPGAIQPHGAFLAALAEGGRVTHASANLLEFLRESAAAALGKPLAAVIGEAACRVLWDGAAPREAAPTRIPEHIHQRRAADGTPLHLRAYRSGRHICLDITPRIAEPGQVPPIATLASILESFRQARSTDELCAAAVRGLKALSCYDRVMAYRLAPDGHGEVIAESCEPGMESYLGLHYPAADIPPQARRLILRQRVGAITDTGYHAVPLLSDPTLDDGTPLDLTYSTLRSASPIHREYLRNMGVAACLTVGLAGPPEPESQHPGGQYPEGRLWGMLVCHNNTPRAAGQDLQAVIDMIGQVMSLLLPRLGEAEVCTERVSRDATLRGFAGRLAAPIPLPEALAAAAAEMLRLVEASGALVRLSDSELFLGRTPPPAAARRAMEMLQFDAGGDLLAIEDLGLRYPELACCTDEGSGALLLPLGQDDAILLFRPELSRTIHWAGDPNMHVTTDAATGRLSPRGSFASWQTTVRGRSAPWAEVDLALAREIRRAIETEVAQRTKADLTWRRYYDTLTGLPNRMLLDLRWAEAERKPEGSAGLLFLDIVGTGEVSNTLGYAAADSLVVEVARRLVATAGPENLAARLGGARFAVKCRGLDQNALAGLGARIREAIAAPFCVAGQSCHVSAIVGIADLGHSHGVDVMEIADRSMQAAKVEADNQRYAEAQRQKMESLGRIMGGVAHEINNMLQPVALLVQDVIDNGLVAVDGRAQLDIVLDCTLKARQIIGDLLAFSRPTARAVDAFDPVALLHESLRLVRQAIPASVSITVTTGGQPPVVAINRTSFVQLLLNLATNAAAAMDNQGELSISLDDDAFEPAIGAAAPPIRFARLRVTDTGCGMTKATLDRVFEPFFTTKAIGQGTGLGMPVVYGLVQAMGGTIALRSEPGRGTTVTILIPQNIGKTDDGNDFGD